ncbi:MAG: hypothetical protein GX811_06985 [Lentisphaerae bacterium]|nr:hypothetical protein [Lentisphaerota bacterium]
MNDGIRSLVLTGNYKQMGRQYGGLLAPVLTNAFKAAFVDHIFKNEIMLQDQARDISSYIWNRYPAKFKEFFAGIAETSDLGLDKLIMLDQYLWLIMVKELDNLGSGTMISVSADYTVDNSMILGRTLDFSAFPDTAFFPPIILVLIPDTGDIPVLTVGFPGQLQSLNAINARGLAVFQNNAAVSGDQRRIFDRTNNLINTIDWLGNSSKLEFIETLINSYRPSFASIALIASETKAEAYEISTSETTKRMPVGSGLLVAANHFINPAWEVPKDNPNLLRSLSVQNNLLRLAEQVKGKLTPEQLMSILDRPLSDQGVSTEQTKMQLVFSQKKRALWVRTPSLRHWIKIDLNFFLDSVVLQ